MNVALIAFALAALSTATPGTQHSTVASLRGERVTIVVAAGILRARLVDMDERTVTVQRNGAPPKVIPLDEVLKIETSRWDSPVDGAVVGTLLALVFAVVANATYAAESKDKGIGTITLAGAAVGGLYDLSHRSIVTLYERPSAVTRQPHLRLSFAIRF